MDHFQACHSVVSQLLTRQCSRPLPLVLEHLNMTCARLSCAFCPVHLSVISVLRASSSVGTWGLACSLSRMCLWWEWEARDIPRPGLALLSSPLPVETSVSPLVQVLAFSHSDQTSSLDPVFWDRSQPSPYLAGVELCDTECHALLSSGLTQGGVFLKGLPSPHKPQGEANC